MAYEIWARRYNEPLFKAMQYKKTLAQALLSYARNLSIDGESLMLAECAALYKDWNENPLKLDPLVPCPLEFTPDEIEAINQGYAEAKRAVLQMDNIREEMGTLYPQKQGIVAHENYELVKQLLNQAKKHFMEEYAKSDEDRRTWEELWPFDD